MKYSWNLVEGCLGIVGSFFKTLVDIFLLDKQLFISVMLLVLIHGRHSGAASFTASLRKDKISLFKLNLLPS